MQPSPEDTAAGRPDSVAGLAQNLPRAGSTIFVPPPVPADAAESVTPGILFHPDMFQPALQSTPERVGDYEIRGVLGAGTMGTVYLGYHPALNREVAIKVIGRLADEKVITRFRTEARAIAALSHPNIVKVFEVGEADCGYYLVMERIEGRSLAEVMEEAETSPKGNKEKTKKTAGKKAERLEKGGDKIATGKTVEKRRNAGPWNVARAVHLVAGISEALEHAHRRGVIHRDLKPANVMVTPDGRPVVTDFGLARITGCEPGSRKNDPSRITINGQVLGTPAYMSPEQARGDAEAVDERSDIYALGAILHELLSGEPVVPRDVEIFRALSCVINREPPQLRVLRPALPRDIETICRKCLDKDAGRRYPSAGALLEDLRRFLAGEPVRARPATLGYRAYRHVARHALVYGVAAAGIMLLLGVMGAARYSLAAERAALRRAETAKLKLRLETLEALRLRDMQRAENLRDRRKLAEKRRVVWQEVLDENFRDGHAKIVTNSDSTSDLFSRAAGWSGSEWLAPSENGASIWQIKHGLLRADLYAASPSSSRDGHIVYIPATVYGDCEFYLDAYIAKMDAPRNDATGASAIFLLTLGSREGTSGYELAISANEITLARDGIEVFGAEGLAGMKDSGRLRLFLGMRGANLALRGDFLESSLSNENGDVKFESLPQLLNYKEPDPIGGGGRRRIGLSAENMRVEVSRVIIRRPLMAALNRPIAFAEKLYRKGAYRLAADEYSEAYLLARAESLNATDDGVRKAAHCEAARAAFMYAGCLEQLSAVEPEALEAAVIEYKKLLGEYGAVHGDKRLESLCAAALGKLAVDLEVLDRGNQAENVIRRLLDPEQVPMPDRGITELMDRLLAAAAAVSAAGEEQQALEKITTAVQLAGRLRDAATLDFKMRGISRLLLRTAAGVGKTREDVTEPESVEKKGNLTIEPELLERLSARLLAAGSSDPRVYYETAQAFAFFGYRPAVIAHASRAADIRPSWLEPRLLLLQTMPAGDACRGNTRAERTRLLDECLSILKSDKERTAPPSAARDVYRLAAATDDLSRTIKAAQLLLNESPFDLDLRLELSGLLLKKGNREKSVEQLHWLIERQPSSRQAERAREILKKISRKD